MIPDTRLYIARPTVMVADPTSQDGQYNYLPKKWVFLEGEAS